MEVLRPSAVPSFSLFPKYSNTNQNSKGIHLLHCSRLDAFIQTSLILTWKAKDTCLMASKRGIQYIFMGSGQIPALMGALQVFREEMQDENVKFIHEYDEGFLHLIISGSDIMLCQSYDDPLLQVSLKDLKYGSAPIRIYFTDSRLRHFGEHDNNSTNFAKYINNTFGNIPIDQRVMKLKTIHHNGIEG